MRNPPAAADSAGAVTIPALPTVRKTRLRTYVRRLLLAGVTGSCAWVTGHLLVVLVVMAALDPYHGFPPLIGALAFLAALVWPDFSKASLAALPRAAFPMARGLVPVLIPDDERLATAGHEAAHLVAAVAHGIPVTEICVRSRRRVSGDFSLTGHVSYGPREMTPDSAWAALVTTLTGNAYDRAHGVPGFLSTPDFDTAHRISADLYHHRVDLPGLGGYASADDIFDQAFTAATTFITNHAETITTARGLLLEHLDGAGAEVITDPDTLSMLTAAVAAGLAATTDEVLS